MLSCFHFLVEGERGEASSTAERRVGGTVDYVGNPALKSERTGILHLIRLIDRHKPTAGLPNSVKPGSTREQHPVDGRGFDIGG